ncbi:MAG: hypothetical protein LBR06_06245 [Bacteroidales bacterium]|nr:hypothetical protein [Bacteroidales bacterium]
MKRVLFLLLLFLISLSPVLLLTSCDKDDTTIPVAKAETAGLWALSEGNWGSGDGQLAYFDYNSDSNKFVRDNNRRLPNFGDTPNDMLLYGAKLYVAITGSDAASALLKVVNPATGTTIRDVIITDASSARQQPRRLTAYNGQVYASLYGGGIARLDTATFTFDAIALSGSWSEGIAEYGGALYVCNSGLPGEAYGGNGNTISKVDAATFSETAVITTPVANPVNIVSAGNGELYFNTGGDYFSTGGEVHVLNTATGAITSLGVAATTIAFGNDCIYAAGYDWLASAEYDVTKIAIADKTVSNFITAAELDGINAMFTYKLAVDAATGEVFLTQQMGEDIYRFKKDGTYIETLKTGQQNGAAIAFIRP